MVSVFVSTKVWLHTQYMAGQKLKKIDYYTNNINCKKYYNIMKNINCKKYYNIMKNINCHKEY